MSSMSWPSLRSVLADWIRAAVIEAWSFLTGAMSAASFAQALGRQRDVAGDVLVFGAGQRRIGDWLRLLRGRRPAGKRDQARRDAAAARQ